MKVQFKKLHPDAKMPTYGSTGAAGADLYALYGGVVVPGEASVVARFSTGIAAAIPPGFYGRIADRSRLAGKGIHVLGGIIDSDYRGEIVILLSNLGSTLYKVSPGDRIAQILFEPCVQADFEAVDDLPETARGQGGFGSTGA